MVELKKLTGSRLEIRVITEAPDLDILIEWRTKHFANPKTLPGGGEYDVVTKCSTSLGHMGMAFCSTTDDFSPHKGRAKSLERAIGEAGLNKEERKALWAEVLAVLPPPKVHARANVSAE